MNPLEKELSEALRREEPSPEFTERILARIAEAPSTQKRGFGFWFLRPTLFRWAAATLVVIIGVWFGTVELQRYQREKQRGEEAKAQVVLALQIASAKIHMAQRIVQEKTGSSGAPETKEQQ